MSTMLEQASQEQTHLIMVLQLKGNLLFFSLITLQAKQLLAVMCQTCLLQIWKSTMTMQNASIMSNVFRECSYAPQHPDQL